MNYNDESWRRCAERLREFAIAYRSHPLRNPADKLDEVLALYDTLAAAPEHCTRCGERLRGQFHKAPREDVCGLCLDDILNGK